MLGLFSICIKTALLRLFTQRTAHFLSKIIIIKKTIVRELFLLIKQKKVPDDMKLVFHYDVSCVFGHIKHFTGQVSILVLISNKFPLSYLKN